MDLFRSMRAFVTTVQAGSMSAAACSLKQTPAMIRQHIAALEEQIGTRLLNRTTRRQSLTDFGATYFEQCRDILDRVTNAQEDAELQRSTPYGKLRITAPTTFGAEALTPALLGFREIAPAVELEITLTDRNVDLVEEGFDVAFRIGAMPESSVIARPLTPYRMVICASPTYLARKGIPSSPNELTDHEIIAFTPSARSTWRLSQGDREVRISPKGAVTINSGQAVRAAIRAGMGIAMQPKILMREDIEEGRLVHLLPDWQLGERPMWLVYYRDRRMTARLRSFIDYSFSTFGSENPDA